eukprot:gene26218-biopygen14977
MMNSCHQEVFRDRIELESKLLIFPQCRLGIPRG